MFSIDSNRLRLIPLTLDQLQLHLHHFDQLCTQLGVVCQPVALEKVFQDEFDDALLNYWIPQVAANQRTYKWFTNWVIVHRQHNKIVGGIGVAGLPNDNGETEVGYGIDQNYRQQGIATEALNLLTQWVCNSPEIEAIIAHTPIDLLHSQQVLLKAGFKQIEEKDGILLWRKKIK